MVGRLVSFWGPADFQVLLLLVSGEGILFQIFSHGDRQDVGLLNAFSVSHDPTDTDPLGLSDPKSTSASKGTSSHEQQPMANR